MEPVRTTILTSIMAPHRIAPFNALADMPDVDLTVIYLARSDPSRRWATYEGEMRYGYRVLREYARIRHAESYVHVTSRLLPELRRSRPQVIVAGGWDQLAYHEARLIRHAIGARFLWWVESNLRDRRPEWSALSAAKHRLLNGVDGVVVTGRAAQAYVASFGVRPDRVWIAPNAVDNEFFASPATDRRARAGPVRFLFASRLEPGKGVAYLLDAWSLVPGDVELVIVGSGSLDEAARERVARAAMPPVRFLGHLDREQLARAYADADVFVFPSVWDAWGLVLNEAMAAGLPVVAASAPGAVDDLIAEGDNGFVVPPFDSGALAYAMSALAIDPARRLEMGERSSAMIRAFEPERWAEGMRRAVLATVGGGPNS